MTVEEYRHKIIMALNDKLCRYNGGTCEGKYFPDVETFDVDDVYEMLDSIYFDHCATK